MLRVVRLPETSVEAAPVSMHPDAALDDCLRRDGWLAFRPNIDVWALPLPFGEPPFKVASDTSIRCPGLNPQTVWLHARDGRFIEEYNGVTRETARRVESPERVGDEPWYILAESVTGFFAGYGYESGLYHWEPGRPPELLLADVSPFELDPTGKTFLCWSHSVGELVLYDIERGTHHLVPRPDGAEWPHRGAVFSPDGQWLAIDLDYSPQLTQEELFAQLQEAITGRAKYSMQPHRLGIIRCSDGSMTISDAEYDNFANLIWTLDSERIIFSTPFAPRVLWTTQPGDGALERIAFKKHAPSLLCDVSDLIS